MAMRTVLAAGLWGLGLASVLTTTPVVADDDVILTVTKHPGNGEIRLVWTGGASVYGVFRATLPIAVHQPSSLQEQTADSEWVEPSPATPLIFYVVNDPPCATDADCVSGHCTDGVCCDTGCAGTCELCNLSASLGICKTVPPGMDAGAECDVHCADLPPLATGVCAVTPGSAETLLVGTVLGSPEVFVGGEILIDAAGTIACVGCDCAATAPTATVVTCPSGVIAPGLINSFDHLTFAQNQPHTETGERWEHRHEWRLGSNGHTQLTAAGGASADQQRWAELRQLMSGTTSIVAAGGSAGLLRNLSTAANQGGLGQFAPVLDVFPLGDSSGTMLASGCGYPSIRSAASVAGYDAYSATAAEGISAAAHNEFACLSSSSNGGQNLVLPQSSFRHAIGVTASDLAVMASGGAGLVWSPRSNISLYGDTAPVTAASRLGVTVALGTDWIVSGSMSLQRELACARAFNETYLDGFFTDAELMAMATRNGAELTATDDVIGTLALGKIADIAIFDGSLAPRHHAVVTAGPPAVTLVMRGGTAIFGDAAIVESLRGVGCDALDVCGRAKQLCLQSEIGKTFAQLQASVGGAYPTFFCDTPSNEPSCVPFRGTSVSGSTTYTGVPTSDDLDGDGIATGDNCALVFNPVRPLDNGTQADADADGLGDSCDPCPTSAICPP